MAFSSPQVNPHPWIPIQGNDFETLSDPGMPPSSTDFLRAKCIWGVFFPSELGAQATQTIPEKSTRRRTTTPPSLIFPKFQWHIRNRRPGAHKAQFLKFIAKISKSRSSRLYPSFASVSKLALISLTSIPKNCLPDLCATLYFFWRVWTSVWACILWAAGAGESRQKVRSLE